MSAKQNALAEAKAFLKTWVERAAKDTEKAEDSGSRVQQPTAQP